MQTQLGSLTPSKRDRGRTHSYFVVAECAERVCEPPGFSGPEATASTCQIGNFRQGIASRTSKAAGPEGAVSIHRIGNFRLGIASRSSTAGEAGSIH